jgi:diadenosine tetraphosphatase ApaH/serine/threonine PP2A family protein phosphatase
MKPLRYAVFGDVHANIEALDAVLADAGVQGVTDYVCVGDIVGYNASPAECLERVRALNCDCVRGNHDHYCAHDESLDDFHPLAASVVDWTRKQLSTDQLRYLRELKMTRMVKGFTVVHSTLDMPDKWGYVFDGLDAESHFSYQTTTVCFHGHTHIPVVYERDGRARKSNFTTLTINVGQKYFINTGSVGQPRDGDSRAAYLVYTPSARTVELRRVPYDVAGAQKKVRAAGLPERIARRLELGR